MGLFPKGSTPQSGSGLHRFGTMQAQINSGEGWLLPTPSQERAIEEELLLAKGTRLHLELSFLQAAS